MVISCREVIREVSNYMDDDLEPGLGERIRGHLADCEHCKAIYDGTKNVITLVCDERAFTLPKGFSARLYSRLNIVRPS